MQSPEEFAKGVGLGTTSLIRNVAGGALTSGIGKCSLEVYLYVLVYYAITVYRVYEWRVYM